LPAANTGTRDAVLHATPFAVAWTLVAAYCGVLVAVAIRVAVRLARARSHDSEQAE
jgi:hypothetical protein